MMTTQDWRAKAKHFDFQGHQIAYWTGGDTEAQPLLLVHGFPTCSWDWVPVWETLGAKHHLIACDMLGFGLSDKPRDGFGGKGYTIHWQTDVQAALLAHLGIESTNALVHDYGVSVGQEMLWRQLNGTGFGGLDQCLFLNGGIFPDFHRPRLSQKIGISPVGFLFSKLINRKRFGEAFSEVFGPATQPSAQELDEFWELMALNDGHRIQHKLLAYMKDRQTHKANWRAALEGNQGKIGLINGALDPVSGEHVYKVWREFLPGARHHLIPDVGHYPQVEAPDEVAAKVLEWLG